MRDSRTARGDIGKRARQIMLQAALFDMDGLLLDTERVGLRAFVEVARDHGLAPRDAELLFLRLVGKTMPRATDLILAAIPGVDVARLDADWHAALDRAMAQTVPLRPSVAETLAALSAAGIAMAVVTTTRTDRARHHLALAGILGYFVDVVGIDRVSRPKPDPEPYHLGASILGLAPENCAAFEDSDTGTLAAIRAGCAVWQVPDLRPDGSAPDQVGQELADTLAQAVAASRLLSRGSFQA
ncbi:MAG: HAD family phosphatase [Pseudomonadota bacterium]